MIYEIKNQIHYDDKYGSELLRGADDPETPRPWNLFLEIKQFSSTAKTLLDIGCGTAIKLIPLFPYFHKIIAIDPSQSMLKAADDIISQHQAPNVDLIKGDAEHLPCSDHSIDVVTSMLSRWDTKEVWRVLKPDGNFILEFVGCEDKKAFKVFFGQDSQGWRGQFLEYSVKEFIELCYNDISRFFNSVIIRNGYWNTTYSEEGIRQLLSTTPAIRNYNQDLDKDLFNFAIKACSNEKGIQLTQNRILVHATNPKMDRETTC